MVVNVIDKIAIRRWRASDFNEAVVLNREAESPLGIPPETGDWTRDMLGIKMTFLDSGGEFLVGHINARLVVMGGFKPLDETTAEIKRIRVTPSLHRKGVGRWFLGLLEDSMRSKGITEARVSTLSAQTGAIRL